MPAVPPPTLGPSPALVSAIQPVPVGDEGAETRTITFKAVATFHGRGSIVPRTSLRRVLEGVLVVVWSNNLLADGNRICECALASVLSADLYKMQSRWPLLPALNEWSKPVGTQREICG